MSRAHLPPEAPPLATVRKVLFWALLAGAAGTLAELLLIGHDESAAQFVPLALLAATLVSGLWFLAAPGVPGLRLLQLLAILLIGSGIVGVGLHYRGNEVFELEMAPSLSGATLLKETLTGATPVLAPGSMSLLGVVGLSFTYGHPLLYRRQELAAPEENS